MKQVKIPYSPATPSKSAKASPMSGHKGVALPSASSTEKQTSTSKVKQPVTLEPSPASTYGETAVGDSSPVTPFEPGQHDATAALLDSLKAVHIESTENEQVGSSPVVVGSTGHPAYGFSSVQSSFHGNGNIGSSKHPSTASADSSPSGRLRTQGDINSPSWRSSSEFVQHSRGSQAEDPFVSPTHDREYPESIDAQDTPSRRSKADTGTPTPTGQSVTPTRDTDLSNNQTFTPREDRAGQEISVENAQAMLPPTACVFVANLSSLRTDDQLEFSVTKVFQEFGTVYVKIRRDSKGMPFAFCQYENVADADQAVHQGRGRLIDGRPCRTERAKVNRSLFLSKISGGPITEDEAHKVLDPYGAIEKLWYNTQTDKEMFRLPEGIWAMFAYFQDCRDAQAAFRENYTYRLEQPAMPADIKTRLNRQTMSPTNRFSPGRVVFQPQMSVLRKVTEDCTIFVGSLPPTVTQEQLMRFFGGFGHVRSVEIVAKASANNSGVNVFAFVEFSSEQEACAALDAEHTLDGFHLRVERKESIEPSARRTSGRRTPPGAHFIGRNTANLGSGDDITHFYNRALEMGVPLPTAAEIFSPPRRSGETFQTAVSPALYSGTYPYSYYQAQYNAGPSGAQYANQTFDTTHEENVSGMSPNRQSQAYYSQGGGQGPMTPNTGLRTSAATAPLQSMVHPSVAQPMGQFQYPHPGLAYGQYPGGPYSYYPTGQTASGTTLFQYVYPQTDNQTQSSVTPAGSGEERESH